MNTESSRSHAILLVSVRKASVDAEGGVPTFKKGKLLIVDLAGSERIQKSGAEGMHAEEAKFINLSLTALGKCINALAEGSPHIPTRDSKLTRLLRDSFGGSARTSLVITISPSGVQKSETASTIQFGQRAMKVRGPEYGFGGEIQILKDCTASGAKLEGRSFALILSIFWSKS
jgi:kinesin family protein 5